MQNHLRETTLSISPEVLTLEEEAYFLRTDYENIQRIHRLKNLVKTYYNDISKLYDYIAKKWQQQKRHTERQVLLQTMEHVTKEETEIIRYIKYLRNQIIKMQDEISFFGGDDL